MIQHQSTSHARPRGLHRRVGQGLPLSMSDSKILAGTKYEYSDALQGVVYMTCLYEAYHSIPCHMI